MGRVANPRAFCPEPQMSETLLGISWATIRGIWVGGQWSWTREYLRCRPFTARESFLAIFHLPHRGGVETSCAAALEYDFATASVVGKQRSNPRPVPRDLEILRPQLRRQG